MAEDLSKLSEDQLRQRAKQKLASMPEDQLRELAKQKLAGQGLKPDRKIAQETHKDINWSERAAIKNFGTDMEQSAQYLRERHPDMDVEIDGGQIVVKKKDEKDWKTLDPKGFDAADISDIGFDILSGAGSGAATVAGGLVGGLPGAVGAGAVSSGALESLRQAIGKKLGVSKAMSGSDIALATGLGAISPALFGSGATVAQVGKEAIRRGLTEEGKQALAQSQRGAIKRSAAGVTSFFTNVPKRTLSSATKEVSPSLKQSLKDIGLSFDEAKPLSQLEAADLLEQQGLGSYGESTIDEIKSALWNQKEELQNKVGTALEQSGVVFNVTKYEKPLANLVQKLEGAYKEAPTPALKTQIDETKSVLTEYFRGPEGQLGAISPVTAMRIKNTLSDLADYTKSPASVEKIGKGGRELRSAIIEAERGFAADIWGAIEKTPGNQGLKSQYREVEETRRLFTRKFKDPEVALRNLRNYGSKPNKVLREQISSFDKKYGANLGERAEVASVHGIFADTAEPLYGGSARTNKAIAAGGAAGTGLGYAGGKLLGLPGQQGAYIGGIAGAGAGGILSSPGAVKQGLKLGTAGGRFADKAYSVLPGSEELISGYAKAPTVWNLMNKRGEK